jgi:hypothetical protein
MGVVLLLLRYRPEKRSRAIVVTASVPIPRDPFCGTNALMSPQDTQLVHVITRDGIGRLKIGMPADSVKAACHVVSDTVRPGPEGMSQRVLVVAFGHDLLDAEIVNDSVWRLDVRSPAFKTPDSVGVGSPVGKLLAHWMAAEGVSGEGNFAVVSRIDCGLSFILDGKIPELRGRKWTEEELAKLPSDTHVKRILVYKCPNRSAR